LSKACMIVLAIEDMFKKKETHESIYILNQP